jgi:UDP-N-acetylglucosamine:LPS N-acetylglucosamine transferase
MTAPPATAAKPAAVEGVTRPRRRVLVTVAGGGFGNQTLRLIALLGTRYEYEYVVIRGLSHDVRSKLDRSARAWELTVPGVIGDGRLKKMIRMLRCFVEACAIVARSRPDAVICLGTSMSVPLCFWGRVFRAKVIYIDSISRPYKMSYTGELIRRLRFSHRVYVQWPEVAQLARVRYKGRLL